MPNASERFLAVAHRKRYGLRTRAHSPLTLSAALGQRVRRRRSASAALQGDFARLLLSRLDDAEPTVAVTRSPNAINARGPGSPSCPSRAVRAVAVSIRKDNFFKFFFFHAQRRLADGEMRARASAERASASGLGETRPFATATHQVDHGGLAGHGADSRVRRGDPLPTRRSCVSLVEPSATFPFGIEKNSDLLLLEH